jgi:hypothetical protein
MKAKNENYNGKQGSVFFFRALGDRWRLHRSSKIAEADPPLDGSGVMDINLGELKLDVAEK